MDCTHFCTTIYTKGVMLYEAAIKIITVKDDYLRCSTRFNLWEKQFWIIPLIAEEK